MNKVIIISGPTCSGKTELSLKLSEFIDSEIISADSRQIYRYMDIGTAKPTYEELNRVPHHFINICEPDEYYSAGVFGEQADLKIKETADRNKIPLIVGGSGLYIKSIVDGFFSSSYDFDEKLKIRQELQSQMNSFGIEYLIEKLKNIDEKSLTLYPDKNPRRIVRCLEHFYLTGNKFSDNINQPKKTSDNNIFNFGILIQREILYERINSRTNIMWENGILQETEKLLSLGFHSGLNSMKTVGYKECSELINNKITANECIAKIAQNTRRYAKRQMTWFRSSQDLKWLEGSTDDLVEKILKFVKLS